VGVVYPSGGTSEHGNVCGLVRCDEL